MFQRHEVADHGLLPNRQADSVTVLQGKGGFLVGETELLCLWPHGSNLGCCASRADELDGRVDDFGEIVGDSINGTTGVGRATYYNAITGMVDLNTLIPPGSGWALNYAAGINRHGQIVGTGSLNGVGLGFVLTPIPSQILINSVLGLIPHLDNCDACGVFLTDLVQQIPESTTNLTPLQKLELGARVDLLVLGVNVFVSQGFVAAGPGDLVVHQAQELLTALRGSNASL